MLILQQYSNVSLAFLQSERCSMGTRNRLLEKHVVRGRTSTLVLMSLFARIRLEALELAEYADRGYLRRRKWYLYVYVRLVRTVALVVTQPPHQSLSKFP